MDLYFTTKLIQRMDTISLHWRRSTKLHWLLEGPLQIPIRQKSWIFQETYGRKLLNILIMISKFFLYLKSKSNFSKILYFSIFAYATVTTTQGALIIGGTEGSQVATVACYNNSGWSRLDDLQSTRQYHRAIINGDKVYVIGGNEIK